MIDKQQNRILYFDILRVLATLAVITLHISVHNWYETDISSTQWMAYTMYDSLFRWSVPIFVMISGALFLQRDVNLKKLFSKNIFRLATAFVFWSILYAVIEYFQGKDLAQCFVNALHGHYPCGSC